MRSIRLRASQSGCLEQRADPESADRCREHHGSLADSANPNNRVVGALGRVSVACVDGGKASDELQQQAMDRLSDRITLGSYQAFSMLARISSDKQCQGADAKFVVAVIEHALSKADSQPDRAEPKWRLRHSLSLLLARQGRVEDAIAQSQLAWNQRSADTAVGSVLVQLHLAAGNREAANQVLQEIEARRRWSDSLTKDEVRRLREMVSHSQPTPAKRKLTMSARACGA